jgi:hypothetical protein
VFQSVTDQWIVQGSALYKSPGRLHCCWYYSVLMARRGIRQNIDDGLKKKSEFNSYLYKTSKAISSFLFWIYFFPRIEIEADIRKHEFFSQSQQNSYTGFHSKIVLLIITTKNPFPNTQFGITSQNIRSGEALELKLSLKFAVIWDIMPCNVADIFRRFRRSFSLCHYNR